MAEHEVESEKFRGTLTEVVSRLKQLAWDTQGPYGRPFEVPYDNDRNHDVRFELHYDDSEGIFRLKHWEKPYDECGKYTVRDMGNDRIQVSASTDFADRSLESSAMIKFFREVIAKAFPPDALPKRPKTMLEGGHAQDWIDYFHELRRLRLPVTLEGIRKQSGFSESRFGQLHRDCLICPTLEKNL